MTLGKQSKTSVMIRHGYFDSYKPRNEDRRNVRSIINGGGDEAGDYGLKRTRHIGKSFSAGGDYCGFVGGRHAHSDMSYFAQKLLPRNNVYKEHPIVSSRPPCKVKLYRDSYEIVVRGNAPNPIEHFNEVYLPKYLIQEIRRQGYKTPTAIQAQSWPIALSGQNLLGIAHVGSGKTFAYLLPAIIHIKNQLPLLPGDGPIALVLSPTGEMAQRIQEVFSEFGKAAGVRNSHIFDAANIGRGQIRDLQHGCEIAIATPDRLVDLLNTKETSLKRCTYLVLDDADKLLDMGFERQIRFIISHTSSHRQILMWSSTFRRKVKKLAQDCLGNYTQISIGSLDFCACHRVNQLVEVCDDQEKETRLKKLLSDIYCNRKDPGKTIVFAQTKNRVEHLVFNISSLLLRCCAIYTDSSPSERKRILKEFRCGISNILIATDLAMRGLEVFGIKHVINFDYPNSTEDYIHRIGRIGVWNSNGTSFTFFTTKDSKHLTALISLLKETNQEINPDLQQLANEFRNSLDGGRLRCRKSISFRASDKRCIDYIGNIDHKCSIIDVCDSNIRSKAKFKFGERRRMSIGRILF